MSATLYMHDVAEVRVRSDVLSNGTHVYKLELTSADGRFIGDLALFSDGDKPIKFKGEKLEFEEGQDD